MNEVPEFWRAEVFHPLSVHFPIGLLVVAMLFKTIAIWHNKETYNFGGSILLALGVLGLWIAIYTGDLADGIVSRKICDPTILKDHQNFAYITAWIFTISFLYDFILKRIKYKIQHTRIPRAMLAILLIIGTGFLSYTGHLGATLVYQQGAGVYTPSSDCNEFN